MTNMSTLMSVVDSHHIATLMREARALLVIVIIILGISLSSSSKKFVVGYPGDLDLQRPGELCASLNDRELRCAHFFDNTNVGRLRIVQVGARVCQGKVWLGLYKQTVTYRLDLVIEFVIHAQAWTDSATRVVNATVGGTPGRYWLCEGAYAGARSRVWGLVDGMSRGNVVTTAGLPQNVYYMSPFSSGLSHKIRMVIEEDFLCFSKYTTSGACSQPNGTCVARDVCSCMSGYHGNECEEISCPEFQGLECAGHGVCSAPGLCSCYGGYGGKVCSETYICYGKRSEFGDENGTCSHPNGTCSARDTCRCSPGYSGKQCEFIDCHGATTEFVEGNPPCSYPVGSCIAPNTCVCQRGFAGSDCASVSLSAQTRDECTMNETKMAGRLVLWSRFSTQVYVDLTSADYECSRQAHGADPESLFVIYRELPPSLQLLHSFPVRLECNGSLVVVSLRGVLLGPGVYRYGTLTDIDVTFPVNPSEVSTLQYAVASLDDLPSTIVLPERRRSSFALVQQERPIFATLSGHIALLCYNVSSTDPTVCAGNGICVAVDTCRCHPSFGGADCAIPVICGRAGAGEEMCSGRGVCVSSASLLSPVGICNCSRGFEGEICEHRISSSDTLLIVIPIVTAAAFLSCVVLAISTCIGIFCYCRHRKSPQVAPRQQELDGIVVEDIDQGGRGGHYAAPFRPLPLVPLAPPLPVEYQREQDQSDESDAGGLEVPEFAGDLLEDRPPPRMYPEVY